MCYCARFFHCSVRFRYVTSTIDSLNSQMSRKDAVGQVQQVVRPCCAHQATVSLRSVIMHVRMLISEVSLRCILTAVSGLGILALYCLSTIWRRAVLAKHRVIVNGMSKTHHNRNIFDVRKELLQQSPEGVFT